MSPEEQAEAAVLQAYAQLYPSSFSVFAQFLSRWIEAVPELTLLGKAGGGMSSGAAGKATEGADADADPEALESEFVEQEGCPEDTDFNRWSHHTGVGTCEDEVLQHSLGDSGAVSFVFGLEVNWSLLESREAQYREENDLRKEQQRLDLEALNEQRRLKREGLANPSEGSASTKKKGKLHGENGDADSNSDSDNSAEPDEDTEKKTSSAKKKRKADLPNEEAAAGDQPTAKKKKGPAADKKRKSSGGSAGPPEDENIAAKKVKKGADAVEPAGARSVASAPASSSRRAAAGPAIDPLVEIDHTFQADWEFIRRAHEKGKIPCFKDFHAVLKQLKIFNNNWRVLPADYTNPNTPTLYTRIPGMKPEACAGYRAGFDYFVGGAALSRFMYAQASLLGDAALVRDAVQALDQQPPLSFGVQRNNSSDRTESKATNLLESGAPPAVCNKVAREDPRTVAPKSVPDIDFGSDSDDAVRGRDEHRVNEVPASVPSNVHTSTSTRDAKRPARRVIADSDSEGEDTAEVKGKGGPSGETHIASSVEKKPMAVFDLTSPTQRTQAVPVPTPRAHAVPKKPSATTFRGQENRPPNAHSSVTANSSTARHEGGAATAAAGASGSAVIKSPAGLSRGAKDAAQAKRSPPARGAAPSLPSVEERDTCGDSSGGSQADDPAALDWTCSFCTLVNSVRHDPVECSLCGYVIHLLFLLDCLQFAALNFPTLPLYRITGTGEATIRGRSELLPKPRSRGRRSVPFGHVTLM